MTYLVGNDIEHEHGRAGEYSAQISFYRGKVYVNIINCVNSHFRDGTLWICLLDKSFGSFWQSEPKEQDWINAQAWAEYQLSLIAKYATPTKVKPAFIEDINYYDNKYGRK